MKLVTSNQSKIDEYARFGLPVEPVKGKDILEVLADSLTVALYKALEVDDLEMIEDTTLVVDGVEIVDIRYRLNELLNQDHREPLKAKWVVTIAMKDGDKIKVSRGVINGLIGQKTSSEGEKVFGFDDVFYPDGQPYSLHQLEMMNTKDNFSARKNAILTFLGACSYLCDDIYQEIPLASIAPWEGEYQI